jgi:isopentenyl-diphosphate delta-isomerase
MTGGTGIAQKINENLARACQDFGLGMGLGSCRKILFDDANLSDFNVRKFIGKQPLFANLGIAQINSLISQKKISAITEMLHKLQADGLVIHINPVQEWLQPEGDIIEGLTPLQAIEEVLEAVDTKIIVKEVGQGMGPESLKQLMKLPIAAIEFGAFGGTNFAKLENLRDSRTDTLDPICFVGHDIVEMINMIHHIISAEDDLKCQDFIISGGVKDYLDGYYYNELLECNSVYGQAAGFLKHAQGHYDDLAYFVDQQIKGYQFANRYLTLKK